MKRLNINDEIRVKLTDKAKDIYYHQYDELNKELVAEGRKPLEPRYPEVDKDGFTEMPLW